MFGDENDYEYPVSTGPLPEWLQEESPLWMTDVPKDVENDPKLAAIQALMVPETPEEIVETCWKNANEAVKKGKKYYKEAARLYSEALHQPITDPVKRSTLLGNRAMVNLSMGNHKLVLKDCEAAVALNPANVKAYWRAGKACIGLLEFEKAVSFCRTGLAQDISNKDLSSLLKEADDLAKNAKRREKERQQEISEKTKKKNLLDAALASRSVEIGDYLFDSMKQYDVHIEFDEDQQELVFPILFLYEEYLQSDVFARAYESDTVELHLSEIFPPKAPLAEWDLHHTYILPSLDIWVLMNEEPRRSLGPPEHTGSKSTWQTERRKSSREGFYWCRVPLQATILDVVGHPQYVVPGFPVFHVLVRGSKFEGEFLARS